MRILFILSLVFLPFIGSAQEIIYSNPKSKAIKSYEKALRLYEQRKDKEAMEELNKAKEKDPAFVESYVLSANIHYEAREYDALITDLKRVIEINPTYYPSGYFTIAKFQMGKGQYEEALKNYKTFMTFKTNDVKMKAAAELDIRSCEFALNAMKSPVPFDPKNMGPNINSEDYEYFPAITGDDQTLLITRNKRMDQGQHFQEDFYVSTKSGKEWSKAVPIGDAINSDGNEGAPTLSPNGQILIFAACDRRDSYGGCDIYYCRKNGNEWTSPKNIGQPVNSPFWETQPSYSSDGRTLYFISNRKGGYGEGDLYKTILQTDGTWSEPENLGKEINTPGDEESPYIHQDTKTLYFASNGHVGMGGMDIYVAKRKDDGKFETPKNLGYPINTFGDENSLMVNAAGDLAYFSSDRPGGQGMLDLYQFELYKEARPERTTYLKGKVFDKESKAPLGAKFELIDLATGKPVIESSSSSVNGQFLVSVPADKNYALNVSKQGYMFYSENFSLAGKTDNQPFLMDVPLNPVKAGEKVILKNVFFETNSFSLKDESKAELGKLIQFMEKNPTVKIEISGHTDNVGDKQKNQVLSENRAKSVYDFLVNSGKIEKERLSFKGYGDTKPVDTNDTEAGRAINRRTEFIIISK